EPGGHRHAADVVVTPARVTVHEGLGARRAFGLQAQLYSVRSPRSWGIGDLADMRDLAAISGARHGADFLLVNPLHASYPTSPIEPSPYLPTTRRFTSALYLRIEDVPEHRQLPDHARQRIALLKKDVEGWNSRVDRLEREAVRGAQDDLLEDLDPAVVEQARTELAERIEFHAWVQWLLDEQLSAAQAAARDAGMRIGIMHDLAVGVEQVGADAWRLQEVLAEGVTVGAPADQYNQQGQNWHQPPWHPQALRDASYKPWRDMLRSLMRHAGALRIDHVLGLFRLWWIPEGNE